ncbi:MAG: hypothetical protein R3A51_19240 [Nannocystaceae bacterium]
MSEVDPVGSLVLGSVPLGSLVSEPLPDEPSVVSVPDASVPPSDVGPCEPPAVVDDSPSVEAPVGFADDSPASSPPQANRTSELLSRLVMIVFLIDVPL